MSDATCPCCGEIDAVQKVGAVIDAGTQDTAGGAITFAGIGSGNLRIDPSLFLARTQTNLAERLTPTTLTPGNTAPEVFWGVLLVGSSIAAAIMRNAVFTTAETPIYAWVITFLIMFMPGVLVCSLIMLVVFPLYGISRPKARKLWFAKQNYLYDSWYCFRDDVVFDHNVYGTPESFKHQLFKTNSII